MLSWSQRGSEIISTRWLSLSLLRVVANNNNHTSFSFVEKIMETCFLNTLFWRGREFNQIPYTSLHFMIQYKRREARSRSLACSLPLASNLMWCTSNSSDIVLSKGYRSAPDPSSTSSCPSLTGCLESNRCPHKIRRAVSAYTFGLNRTLRFDNFRFVPGQEMLIPRRWTFKRW